MKFDKVITRAILPSRTQILDKSEHEHYRSRVRALWNAPSDRFPGAHPTGLTRQNLPLLCTAPYVAALKTDGVRFMLLLTQRPDGEPIALMIDRGWRMYEVCVWASVAFFKGTLLDGELVFNESPSAASLHFLVFDVVCVSANHVAHRSFGERLQIIHDVLFVPWKALSDLEKEQHVRDERKVWMQQSDICMMPKT